MSVVNIFTDFSQLSMYYDNLASKLDFSEFFDSCEDLLIENSERRFMFRSNADGSPWTSSLVKTGQLRDSFQVLEKDEERIVFGPTGNRSDSNASNDEIAGYQSDLDNIVGGFDNYSLEEIKNLLESYLEKIFEA